MENYPIAMLVDNICHLNNGAMQQIGEFVALQPLAVRAQFASRCAAMIASALENDADRFGKALLTK